MCPNITALRAKANRSFIQFTMDGWVDGWMGGGQACLQHFLATLTPE